MNDFNAVQILRARKQHKCEECRESILVGEKYMRRSGKFEGDMYAVKMCLSCKDAYPTWDVLDAYGLQYDEWPTFGDLEEWLYETLGRPQDVTGTKRERIAAMGKTAREYAERKQKTEIQVGQTWQSRNVPHRKIRVTQLVPFKILSGTAVMYEPLYETKRGGYVSDAVLRRNYKLVQEQERCE